MSHLTYWTMLFVRVGRAVVTGLHLSPRHFPFSAFPVLHKLVTVWLGQWWHQPPLSRKGEGLWCELQAWGFKESREHQRGLRQWGIGFGREVCHRQARESCWESRACRGDFLESKGLRTVRLGGASVQRHVPVHLVLSGQAARGRTTRAELPGTHPLFVFRNAVFETIAVLLWLCCTQA